MRRRTLAALAAGLLLAASGCGGDEMTQFQQDGIAFTHPSGWHHMGDVERDREGGLVVALEGDSGVDGATVRTLAFSQPREPGTLGQYGKSAADTRPSEFGGRLVEDGKVDVTGSDGAWRVVVDYRMRAKDSDEIVPARVIDILPVKGDRQYRLTVSGPKDAVDGDQVQKLIDSFEITSKPTA
jgi:hypothetical protein